MCGANTNHPGRTNTLQLGHSAGLARLPFWCQCVKQGRLLPGTYSHNRHSVYSLSFDSGKNSIPPVTIFFGPFGTPATIVDTKSKMPVGQPERVATGGSGISTTPALIVAFLYRRHNQNCVRLEPWY